MRILALLHVYFMVLDVEASNLLPTPENVTLQSNNFNHTLIWSPGRGTPSGTVYRIHVKYNKQKIRTVKTNETIFDISKYMPDWSQQYTVRLSALFGNRSSSVVERNITPYIDTIIGPPALTISGCGNCFNFSVSLPITEGLLNPIIFYKGIKFCFHLRKSGTEKVITVEKACPLSEKQSTVLYNCFVGNLQLGGNYCVRAQPLLNVNVNTRTSNWFCAFTSTVEERGVAFVAGWTVCSVLAGLCLLIFTTTLVYTRSLYWWRMDLPKALTAVVSGRYFSVEETQLSVAEADTSVKPNKNKQVHQTQTHCHIKENKDQTDREDEDDDEDDDDDYDDDDDNNNKGEIRKCNYMDWGTNNSDSHATNSGQSSTSTASTLCEVAENSGRCIEEFPPAEAEPAPPSSTALSQLLHQHLTGNTEVSTAGLRPEKPNLPILREIGPDGGRINRTEAETDHNISLASVRLMSLQTAADVTHAKDVSQPLVPLLKPEPAENRLDLPKPQETGQPTLLGLHTHSDLQRNAQRDLLNEELPKHKDLLQKMSLEHDWTQTRYTAAHRGELDTETDCLLEEENMEKEEEEEEEDEEEDDCSSGYMKR